MDLQHPLRSLVPSLDSAVLEVLAGTRSGLGASRIARLSARGTRAGQATVLGRLVAHGLVIAEPANHGFLYRLNRDHLLAAAVLQAVGVRAELLSRLEGSVALLTPAPAHASAFGSFARGEAGAESDIDVLLLAEGVGDIDAWDAQIDQFQDRVQRWTGNRCRCLAFTADHAVELAASGVPIVANWLADGLLLSGRALRELLPEVGNKRSRRVHRTSSGSLR